MNLEHPLERPQRVAPKSAGGGGNPEVFKQATDRSPGKKIEGLTEIKGQAREVLFGMEAGFNLCLHCIRQIQRGAAT